MKVTPKCIQCILNVRFREISKALKDSTRSIVIQKELLRISYEEFNRENELTIVATNIFNRLIELSPEIAEYYRSIRRKSIDVVKSHLRIYKDVLKYFSGYEKFRLAIKLSIAGNLLDTGVADLDTPTYIELDKIMSTPITIDHSLEFYNIVREGSKRIMWLFDNAGEAVMDTILIDLLRSMNNYVIGVAKEEPGFQNDLTISDALETNISSHLDKIVSTGYSGSSIHLHRVSKEFLEELEQVDLIVAKGMAHYEYLSGIDIGKDIVFMLVPKCDIVASSLGTKRGAYVVLVKKSSSST